MSNVDEQGRWTSFQRPTVRSVTVTTLQAGQARPYGDSWYRYQVQVMAGEGEGVKPFPCTCERVIEMIQPMIGERLYWTGEAPHPFVAMIETCQEEHPGHWLIEARALYND